MGSEQIINWYPGHMTKAVRQMKEDIKLIDLIIEVLDARIPLSSRNPDIDELGKNRSRLVLLNKADLADEQINKEWISYFEDKGIFCLEINSKNKSGFAKIQEKVKEACKEKIERDKKRGIINRPVRAMVVGIPNVGKSTFINSYSGKAAAKTGNKPGVTKGKQWIKLNKQLELLDTPGILWPKFEDKQTGLNLAYIGSINDEILVMEELACNFIEQMLNYYPDRIKKAYNIEDECLKAHELLEKIAVKRGCILKASQPDISKASRLLFDDFRSGKLGRISLERPQSSERKKDD
ncbi:MAG: ribosome biogenesis GTPase YlqF [Lachnospiraceae bacterium]|nr:ribosome biogenesis GTPase YlqF [Lachnospiraceae bacterium]